MVNQMKNVRYIVASILCILVSGALPGALLAQHESEYAGQETREIKSLSEADIHELRNGEGWGLAKAAELNGIPGPAHLLEMKDEISLSENQVMKIRELHVAMKEQAIPLGNELIELERELGDRFADRSINESALEELLMKIAHTTMRLRFVHLSTHLETPEILTAEQIRKYNELRGYGSGDPCSNVPEGHDAELWKRHNNCS